MVVIREIAYRVISIVIPKNRRANKRDYQIYINVQEISALLMALSHSNGTLTYNIYQPYNGPVTQ